MRVPNLQLPVVESLNQNVQDNKMHSELHLEKV